jgi:cell division protein FtsQ
VARAKKKAPVLPIIAAVLVTVAIGLAASFAWGVVNDIRVVQVTVTGERFAEVETLVAMTEIDSTFALLDVHPDTVVERVSMHPWVADASVRRWPNGRVDIRVREREPVLLAIDNRGAPSVYLDAEGYVMPFVKGAAFNVPVLRGDLPRFTPGAPTSDGPLMDMAAALKNMPKEVTALISEVERRDGELWVRTLPAGDVGMLNVRLGKHGFDSRLYRLHDFWHQAVLTRPDRRYALVDLRFDSQIITRESVIN